MQQNQIADSAQRYLYRATLIEGQGGRDDFGLVDDKGRRIGFWWQLYSVTWTPTDEPYRGCSPKHRFKFEARTHALRDGDRFGALPASITGDTIEEVLAKVSKRREGSSRRYAKQFGGVS